MKSYAPLFRLALALRGMKSTISFFAPCSQEMFNIFMNVSILPDGEINIGTALSKPGGYVALRAEMDLAFSDCCLLGWRL